MKKVLFVATVVKTHIMEFHIPYLQMFKEMGWETAVASQNDYENPADCVIPHCDQYYDIPFERFPLKLANIKAYRKLKKIINEQGYDIIHCHTPVGAMITRLAAIGAKRKGTKVIYTAHGFHFFKGAPLSNWLIYYPVEWLLAFLTDVLITINKEDYDRAQKFKAKKVCYVPGVGIDTSKFSKRVTERDEKRKELGIKQDDFVLLSVGELIARKNHAVVLKALAEIKGTEEYKKIQYLICGRGKLDAELKALANELGIADHVHFLGYRSDIPDICNCSDLFVFMSLQEGLPVALMEAMACGMPVICSDIRGNCDLVEHEKNGVLLENDHVNLSKVVIKLKNSIDIRNSLAIESRKQIDKFDLRNLLPIMRKIYLDEILDNEDSVE